MRTLLICTALACWLVGCERAAPPTPPEPAPPAPPAASSPGGVQAPSGAPGAAPAPATQGGAAPSPAPAPSAPPIPVEVLEVLALIPGASTALRPGEQTTVDPGATFRVQLAGTFAEARLSLLDAGDAMWPAAGAREVGSTTTVTLQPATPLKPGSAYRLRVDGATTRELRGADGSARAPVEFPILAAGEPPVDQKARTKKAKQRR